MLRRAACAAPPFAQALRHFASQIQPLARAADAAAAELQAAGPAGSLAAAAEGASLTDRYHALISQGKLRPDPAQARCVQRLDRLCRELQLYSNKVNLSALWLG